MSDLAAFLLGLVVGGTITAIAITEGGRQAAVVTGRRIASTAKAVQEAYVEKVQP